MINEFYYLECHFGINKYEVYFKYKSELLDLISLFIDSKNISIFIDDFGQCSFSENLLTDINKSNINFIINILKVGEE